jgi:hypothetical protein
VSAVTADGGCLTAESGTPVDMSHQETWSIEYDVREDAESMFVPAQLLPHAQLGDLVELRSAQPAGTRQGRVADRFVDESRRQFVTVRFD